MEKTDIKRERRDLYAPSSKEFQMVDVPAMAFLMIDGDGDPNRSESYREAVEALFAASYGIKFASKRELAMDYVVGPLEGLWSAEDPTSFTSRRKDLWQWTMMVWQPDWIPGETVEAAIEAAGKKNLPGLKRLSFERFLEGPSVQIMHIGSYDDEGPILARLHQEFMPSNGLAFRGRHHEIYLSDPRKTAPAKMKTVLRQPVEAIRLEGAPT